MLQEMSAVEIVEWQQRAAMLGEVRALIEQGLDAEVADRLVFRPSSEGA